MALTMRVLLGGMVVVKHIWGGFEVRDKHWWFREVTSDRHIEAGRAPLRKSVLELKPTEGQQANKRALIVACENYFKHFKEQLREL
jgi:hypothetical protein